MFTILNKITNETHPVTNIDDELRIIFPGQNKHFYSFIKARLTSATYWNNNQYTITNPIFDPTKHEAIVSEKLHRMELDKSVPKNRTPIKKQAMYNQWFLFNAMTGKSAMFNNLAALARCINVDYQYLYQGILKNTVFAVDKYRFSRNTMLEKDHCMSLLADVL